VLLHHYTALRAPTFCPDIVLSTLQSFLEQLRLNEKREEAAQQAALFFSQEKVVLSSSAIAFHSHY
jgi:hypothetical protein